MTADIRCRSPARRTETSSKIGVRKFVCMQPKLQCAARTTTLAQGWCQVTGDRRWRGDGTGRILMLMLLAPSAARGQADRCHEDWRPQTCRRQTHRCSLRHYNCVARLERNVLLHL